MNHKEITPYTDKENPIWIIIAFAIGLSPEFLITLKLFGIIKISWLRVLVPIWIPILVFALLLMLTLFLDDEGGDIKK